MNDFPQFAPQGDSAFLVYLGRGIDPKLNARVRGLARALTAAPAEGVREVVPAYCTLQVQFDPLVTGARQLQPWVREALARLDGGPGQQPRVVEIPVAYGGGHGPDLEKAAELTGLSAGEVIARHSRADYPCYLVGFTPGFPFLGGLDPALNLPRLDTPRLNVPAGSVGVAGAQAGVYPLGGPGGWHILGRTPARLYQPEEPRPSLIQAGDLVRFKPVESTDFPDEPGQDWPVPQGGAAGFEVLRPGAFTTVQDQGRWGYQDQGVPVSGALDQFSLAAANLLVGNPPGAAALEITVLGPKLKALAHLAVAVCGADLGLRIDSKPADMGRTHFLQPGQVVDFTGAKNGARAVLAAAGGFFTPVMMKSCSVYPLGLMGGPLKAKQVLRVGPAQKAGRAGLALGARADAPDYGSLLIRVIPGPNEEFFTGRGRRDFYSSRYTVSERADRRGIRLTGPGIELDPAMPGSIVSEPNTPGVIQVPAGGEPIILLREQTVGGYAKIATVISSDLNLLARALPGSQIRFKAVGLEEALQAARQDQKALERIAPAG